MSLPQKQTEAFPDWLTHAVSAYDKDDKKAGEMLSHDWIKWALLIPAIKTLKQAEEIQWLLLSRVDAFKDYLLTERKVALQTVRGTGYYIVPPNDQARFAVEEAMRLIRKGLNKGERILDNAKLEEMDIEARKRHVDTQVRMSGVRGILLKQRRSVLQLFAPVEKLS